jgi:hypothetical protein
MKLPLIREFTKEDLAYYLAALLIGSIFVGTFFYFFPVGATLTLFLIASTEILFIRPKKWTSKIIAAHAGFVTSWLVVFLFLSEFVK